MNRIYLVPLTIVLLMVLMIMPAFAEFPDEFNSMDVPQIELSGEMTYNGYAISSIAEDIIEPNFGVAGIHAMSTHNCTQANSYVYATSPANNFHFAGGGLNTWWYCFAQVPQGAKLFGIIAEVIDNDPSGPMNLMWTSNPAGQPAYYSATDGVVASTASDSPDPQLLLLDLTTLNITILDQLYSSSVIVTDQANYLTGLRTVVFVYQLQISPAPATATFTDIPTTHTFFREIEALAASGITGGCGGSNYCPDNNVTRGQMAAFLARALGLHWQGAAP